MFHAVNFINCRVSTVFAYRGADGNVVHKLHHKVSSRVANCMSLAIKENKMGPRTVPWGTPLLISMNSVAIPSTTTLFAFFDSRSQGSSWSHREIWCHQLRVTDTVTSEAHSSGSDYVSNPEMCAVKVDVFGVVFPRDVVNHPQHFLCRVRLHCVGSVQ